MKNTIKKIAVVCFALAYMVSFVSCATTATKDVKDMYGISNTGVVQYPMVAKIKIDIKKVEGIYSGENCSGENLPNCKIEAYYNALEKSGADMLFEPVYSTVTSMGKTEIKVSGYPAKYQEFRELTIEDKELLVAVDSQWLPLKNTIESPVLQSETKSNNLFWPTVGILAGSAILLIIAK